MRESEHATDQRCDDDAAAPGRDAVQRREREKGEVHAEDLGIDAETPPDVAVVFEAVTVAPRKQRTRGRSDRGRNVGEAKPPQRPEDSERKTDEENVAARTEGRPQEDQTEGQPAEDDDEQMWKVMVVAKLLE